MKTIFLSLPVIAGLLLSSCADPNAFAANMQKFNAFGKALNSYYTDTQPVVEPVVEESAK